VEGKSVTAANLAAVMAQSGQRVVLVDADLRRPTQHRIFELNNHQGLTTALVESEAALSDLLQTTRVENLSVVTSGPLPPNPSELLGSRRMEAVIEALQQRAEVVIFDSPPVMAVTDATVLAARVDGTLLVINSGKTRRALAQRSVETLAAVGARVLGVALNRLASRHGGYYYYHYYYSEDGQRRRHSRRGLLTRLFSRNGHATHGTEAAKAPTGEARDSVHKN
jgi:capsular exopolysaccharide synthesis family protein